MGANSLLAFLFALLVSQVAAAQTPASPPRPLTGAVSIAPLQSLLEPLIAAANAIPDAASQTKPQVSVLIPPGRSEHGYEAPPSRLMSFKDADVIVLVGLGLEPQVQKFLAEHPPAAGRARRIVVFAEVVGAQGEPHDHEHHHEPGEACEHHGPDAHLWLDPVLVESLVTALTREVRELVKGDAAAASRVVAAGETLRQRVRAVHEEYALTCGQFSTRTFVVGHDAWRRLAERYGLNSVAIAGLAASEPTPKALDGAKQAVREQKLKAVFAEPQLSDRAARRIAESAEVEVRRLDPLGTGDWFAMMQGNLTELKRTMGPPAEPKPQP